MGEIENSSYGLLFGLLFPSSVVFSLATLAVIELRGAIPVGYLLQLKPVTLNVFSVLGMMVVVNNLDEFMSIWMLWVIFVENILKLESDSVEEFVGSSVLRHLMIMLRDLDHAKNEVFYNKTQVNNRDMSIAVLRMFISKQKEEHEANLSKRAKKSGRKVSENGASGNECNGDSEVTEKSSVSEEPCSTSKEMVKTMEGKARGELKPPRVLEVLVLSLMECALSASGLRALRYAREIEGINQVVALDNDEGEYGSYPLRGKYCHEMALRILLSSIESHANRYKRYIVPVLSVQMDFYVRVFVRIYTSAGAMKNTPLKLSYVYQCVGCGSFHLQPIGRTLPENNSVRYLPGFGPVVPQECTHCRKKFNMGGPIWSAPIHDLEWVTSILDDVKSMKERYPAYGCISVVLTAVSEVKKAIRFLPNPERHWGPKVKAGRTITSKHVSLLGPEAVNGYLDRENGGGCGNSKLK
ncbi:Probable tRNA (guanine(26)-N(2))-dimethyltransferase 1 [Linum perenne]